MYQPCTFLKIKEADHSIKLPALFGYIGRHFIWVNALLTPASSRHSTQLAELPQTNAQQELSSPGRLLCRLPRASYLYHTIDYPYPFSNNRQWYWTWQSIHI